MAITLNEISNMTFNSPYTMEQLTTFTNHPELLVDPLYQELVTMNQFHKEKRISANEYGLFYVTLRERMVERLDPVKREVYSMFIEGVPVDRIKKCLGNNTRLYLNILSVLQQNFLHIGSIDDFILNELNRKDVLADYHNTFLNSLGLEGLF